MKRSSVKYFAIALLVLVCLGLRNECQGQALTADLLGTVRDSSGAVIPDARAMLSQVGAGATFSATSDASGNYRFAQLAPAHYRLEVSKAGFQKTVISDVELLVAQRQQIDVTLRVGSANEKVEVSAGVAELLETQTAEVGQVIQDKPIVDLPLNGRGFIQLATLAPGVYSVGAAFSCASANFGAGAAQGTASFVAMGFRESDISYLIDGIETRGARFGNATIRPSPDAIQEFKVQTQNYGADNGRSSIIVNLSLKSGSDKFHGSAYEFLRNSALDGNDFFLNLAKIKKPGFQQNNFGASIGGPIIHGKTFFFGDYEGLRSLRSLSLVGVYPSAAQLAGNLADDSTGTGIFPTSSPFCQANPGAGKCVDVMDPTTGTPFAGNVIPSGRLDPIAQKWIPYINAPNVAVAPNQQSSVGFNFTRTPKELSNADLFHIRVDHIFREKDRLFGSFSFDQRPHTIPALAILGAESFPWRAMVLSVAETHVFTPTIVNELHFGYNRSRNGGVAETAFGKNYAQDVFGFKNVPNRPIGFGVPGAGINGFSCIGSQPFPEDSLDRSFQYIDNLSIARGKHTIKLGGTISHEKFIYICDCEAVPGISFSGQYTGAGLGDFLLGTVSQATQSVGEGKLDSVANFYSAYFQDDIRVRPNLTVNLGVRYQYQQSPQAIDGRAETFLESTNSVAAVFRGEIRNGIVKPDYKDWSPRVGIAYSPFRNTVIRSAYGIFYGTGNYNEFGFIAFGPDFIIDQSLTGDPVVPNVFLNNLFPAITLGPLNIGPNIGIFAVNPNNRTPYVQEWGLDVQRTFGNWLVDIGYVGNVGNHLQQRRDVNTPSFDPTGTIPIAARRPLPNYSWILQSDHTGWSSYNGLLAKVEKRVSTNSFLLASYTWAKTIDTFQQGYGEVASRDVKFYDKGLSEFAVPHRFSASYGYTLPFGKHQQYWSGASGIVDKLVSGWTVSGITTFQSGQYESARLSGSYCNLGPFSQCLPDKVPGVSFRAAHPTFDNYFNPAAFALPGCPSLTPCATELHIEGNGRKGDLQGPGENNWDISAEKTTAIGESFRVQFRTELFNALNHVQLGLPSGRLNSANFGQITSLLIPPREIQFGLKLLW